MEALHLPHVVVLNFMCVCVGGKHCGIYTNCLDVSKKIDPPWSFRLNACSISISLNSCIDKNSYWMFFSGTCFSISILKYI
jgi:hypothetical protein